MKDIAKIKTLIVMCLLMGGFSVSAQQASTAAGGEASGSGGKVSFSIGQVDYSSASGSSGSVSQGVQQTYEILDTNIGIKKTDLTISLIAYPNPTSELLTIETENHLENLSYRLYDMNGKIILQDNIKETKTQVDTKSIVAASYVLHIIQNNQIIKSFKIIKN